MQTFHVSQGQTHDFESKEEYLWSQQRSRNGAKNIGYETMKKVRAGDIIFHGANRETYALSVAKGSYKEVDQPRANEIAAGEGTWNKKGYKIESDYTILKTPLDMKKHEQWLADHHVRETAFDRKGHRSQSYLKELPFEQAEYILLELVSLPQDAKTLTLINHILIKIRDQMN